MINLPNTVTVVKAYDGRDTSPVGIQGHVFCYSGR